jgi:hypothetical protein
MLGEFFINVVQLENNKYFISSESINNNENKNKIEWTTINWPLSIIDKIKSNDKFDEDKITKKYMAKYGIENVRGGSYINTVLEEWQIKSLEHELKNFMNEDNCISNVDTKYKEYLEKFPTSKQIYWEKERITEIIKLTTILNDNIEKTKYLFDIHSYNNFKNTSQIYKNKSLIQQKKDFLSQLRIFGHISELTDDKINYLFDNLPEIMLITSDMFNNDLFDIKSCVSLIYNFFSKHNSVKQNIATLKQMQEKSNGDIYIDDGNIDLCYETDDEYHYFDDLIFINLNVLDEIELFPFVNPDDESYIKTNIKMLNIIISNIHLFRSQNEALLKKILRREKESDFSTLINELRTKFGLLIKKEIELIQRS